MALTIDKQIEELNELIRFDFDAIGAYNSAIDDIKELAVREPLIRFRGDHERHVQNLSLIVSRLGGKPVTGPDIKGIVRKTMTKVAGLGGVELTLKAMKSNEEVLNKTYAHHLSLDWPDDVKQIIRSNYADEQRHLAWVVEALQTKMWEVASDAHP
jgi:uncharacterized protein (TIGR02284 family)